MHDYRRPVILLGDGARGVDLTPILSLGVPILTSWAAKDLIDNDHPNYYGSPGQYGQRMANKIMYEADMIMSLGNRMSIWNCGYEGPRPDQQLAMVDVDALEVAKFPKATHIRMTVAEWLKTGWALITTDTWLRNCKEWRAQYPLVESPAHDDAGGYINSYRFVDALQEYMRADECIVTDMGTAHICASQVLRLKPPQRLISSGGLGEMGCGLPMAIGASFARNRGEVLCLVGDGGIMMNLQELQTIIHYRLPIKIIVFSNDGYGMIKETQVKASRQLAGVNAATGVSVPSFRALAQSMGFPAADVLTWQDYNRAIPQLFHARGPALVEYHMHTEQPLVPKLDPVYVDGKPTSPRFCDMSPML